MWPDKNAQHIGIIRILNISNIAIVFYCFKTWRSLSDFILGNETGLYLVLNSETSFHYHTWSLFSPTLFKRSSNSVRKPPHLWPLFHLVIKWGLWLGMCVSFHKCTKKILLPTEILLSLCGHCANICLLLEEEENNIEHRV